MDQVRKQVGEVNGPAAVIGNERLAAQAGAVLLPLILVVIASAGYANALLSIHISVGVLLIGPLAVMIGSAGYRFLRYYTKSPAFVQRGKPPVALRVLAPLLLITTVLVVGTGLLLLVTGPRLLVLHVFSALVWLPAVAIHAFAHVPRIPRLIADEWRSHRAAPGRAQRLGVTFGAVVVGAIAAAAVQPLSAAFVDWSKTVAYGPGPFAVGIALTALAALASRSLRWK